MTRSTQNDARSGLVAGGRGGPEDQLLEDGQEEVFAREEVQLGRIEHHVDAGSAAPDAARAGSPTRSRPSLR